MEAPLLWDPALETFTTLNSPQDPLQQVEQDLLVGILSKAGVQLTLCIELPTAQDAKLTAGQSLAYHVLQEMSLSQEQTDSFASVIRTLHLQVTTTNSSREECYTAFKASLISVSVHRFALRYLIIWGFCTGGRELLGGFHVHQDCDEPESLEQALFALHWSKFHSTLWNAWLDVCVVE